MESVRIGDASVPVEGSGLMRVTGRGSRIFHPDISCSASGHCRVEGDVAAEKTKPNSESPDSVLFAKKKRKQQQPPTNQHTPSPRPGCSCSRVNTVS